MDLLKWSKRPAAGVEATRPQINVLRGLVARATTPLLPDDYLHLLNPLWSARELRGRIVAVRKETDDTATVDIETGWGFSHRYRPGQYVGIGLQVEGRWHWRSYSLTSIAGDGQSHLGDGEGESRRLPVQPPRRRCTSRAPSSGSPHPRATSRCPVRRRRRCCSSPPVPVSRPSWRCCVVCALAATCRTWCTCTPRRPRIRHLPRRTRSAAAGVAFIPAGDAVHPGRRQDRPPRPGVGRPGLAGTRVLGLRPGRDARRRRTGLGKSRTRTTACTSNGSRSHAPTRAAKVAR